MGCYNMIGSVSNLPILMNDECVGLICIRKENKDEINFAPNEHIKPIFPAFYGLYNDYGHLENVNIEDEYMKHFLKNLNMNIENLQTAITHPHFDNEKYNNIKNILKINDNEKLVLCLEHKKVFDYLSEQGIDDLQRKWNENIDEGRIVFDKQRKQDELQKLCQEKLPENLGFLFDCLKTKFRLLNETPYTGWMKYYTIFDKEFTLDYEDKTRRIPYLKTSAFWFILGAFDIPFNEPCYGGQTDIDSLDIHMQLNRIYSNILNKQKKEINEEE